MYPKMPTSATSPSLPPRRRGLAGAPAALVAITSALFSGAAFACHPGFATTSPNYCFVSEIGGCFHLPAVLASMQPSRAVTVVVDEICGPFQQTLTLPGRITLAGVGRDGDGALLFENLGLDQPALAIADGHGHVQIRDILIQNTGADANGIGLDLDGNSLVTLNGVRIGGFATGIRGRNSYSVLINQSNVSNNDTNLWLGSLTNTWRVRDSVLSRAAGWSVVVRGPNNDVLLDGNRLESNRLGGIQLYGDSAVLSNNRLQFNGAAGSWHGIEVRPSAQQSRLLSNYFSTDVISDSGTDTRCAFNTNVVEPPSCQ